LLNEAREGTSRGLARIVLANGTGGEAVGLAQIVGQVGKGKPSARTPVSGLYLVG